MKTSRDLAKLYLGMVLLVGGNSMAILLYPKGLEPPQSATLLTAGAPLVTQTLSSDEQLSLVQEQCADQKRLLARYYRWVLISLSIVDLAAVLMYLSLGSFCLYVSVEPRTPN
jgi:hypothetical protein